MEKLTLILVMVTIILAAATFTQADSPVILRYNDNLGQLTEDTFTLSSPQRAVANNNTAINLNPGSGIIANTPALDAFNRAAQTWQNYLGDDVTLNININMASLGTGILGSASTSSYYANYDFIRDMVATGADTGSSIEAATLSYLPTAAQYSTYAPVGFTLSGDMEATRANLLALGVSQAGLGGLGTPDASITFSTNFTWDYDDSDGITAGAFSFESVATHEIGHSLGFVSEVDYADYILSLSATAALRPSPLDLFRFAADNVPTTSGTSCQAARTTSLISKEIYN
ncbi:MAG: hypothetical protein FVQ80_03860 [Planctomycetes bacterium]|nr:hypothetical protein [Planctomycetota bacterium]